MLFKRFSEQSKEKNLEYLAAYLKDFGYGDVRLEEIRHLHEHGECYYYKSDALFIKITPRVSHEIRNMHFLMGKGFSFVLPALFGTSANKEILITPAIAKPHYMIEQIDRLVAKEIEVKEFLQQEIKVLQAIETVHKSEIGSMAIYPDYPKFLQNTWQELLVQLDHEILKLPILLDGLQYPSIQSMTLEILEISKGLKAISGQLIHGEFSHTNVGLNNEQTLVIYDWEKMRHQADPCWDIAKWIKYFHKFYVVAKSRKGIQEGGLQIKNGKLFITRNTEELPCKKRIVNEIVNFFIASQQGNAEDLKNRIYSGLFLSNLYSLGKTELKYKWTMPLMISALVDAYAFSGIRL